MSDNVKIYMLVRPELTREEGTSSNEHIDANFSTERFIVIERQPMAFDHVFYANSSQEDVFLKIVSNSRWFFRPFVSSKKCFRNQVSIVCSNICICASGHSGAGKTFTMDLNEQNSQGIVTMILDTVFSLSSQAIMETSRFNYHTLRSTRKKWMISLMRNALVGHYLRKA